MNLILIGYRGVGKSAVARLLAPKLGFGMLDCDAEIERAAGRSIAEIFASAGEPAFREQERRLLAAWVHLRNMVVATGGGAVIRADNRQLMRQMGRVVWLTCDAETIAARLAADAQTARSRPNLTPAGGLDEIVRLLKQRQPWYQATADWRVDTRDKSAARVADEVANLVRAERAQGESTAGVCGRAASRSCAASARSWE